MLYPAPNFIWGSSCQYKYFEYNKNHVIFTNTLTGKVTSSIWNEQYFWEVYSLKSPLASVYIVMASGHENTAFPNTINRSQLFSIPQFVQKLSTSSVACWNYMVVRNVWFISMKQCMIENLRMPWQEKLVFKTEQFFCNILSLVKHRWFKMEHLYHGLKKTDTDKIIISNLFHRRLACDFGHV